MSCVNFYKLIKLSKFLKNLLEVKKFLWYYSNANAIYYGLIFETKASLIIME